MSLDDAIRSWDIEVEDEAERLIERGVPPYEAIERARKEISWRRERKAIQAGGSHAK